MHIVDLKKVTRHDRHEIFQKKINVVVMKQTPLFAHVVVVVIVVVIIIVIVVIIVVVIIIGL